jgi:hypothetical protein
VLLSEAYGVVGQPEKGLAVLSEALAFVNANGERAWEAELYRLQGGLTLQKLSGVSSQSSVPNPQPRTPSTQRPTPGAHAEAEQEAEGYFLKAIDIARQQQAKSWELRAAASLTRLWQRQGKQHEARQLLAEIYGWFTEGFDTKDLQEVKSLLEELA